MSNDKQTEGQPITMTYRNYRGEVSDRTVTPKRIWWGSTDWHPEPGWLMTAYDPDKKADRDFALADADFRRSAPAAPAEVEGLGSPILDIRAAFIWARDARPAGYERAILKIEALLEGALPALTALQAENERLRTKAIMAQPMYSRRKLEADLEDANARAEKAETALVSMIERLGRSKTERDDWESCANSLAHAIRCGVAGGKQETEALAAHAKLKGDV